MKILLNIIFGYLLHMFIIEAYNVAFIVDYNSCIDKKGDYRKCKKYLDCNGTTKNICEIATYTPDIWEHWSRFQKD